MRPVSKPPVQQQDLKKPTEGKSFPSVGSNLNQVDENEQVEKPEKNNNSKKEATGQGDGMRREEVKEGKRVRQVLFFIIVGTNGTGKTTLTKQLINTRKTLVVDPDGLEWAQIPTIDIQEITLLKEGKHARIIAPDYKDIIELVNYRNGNLVLDDCEKKKEKEKEKEKEKKKI